MTQYKDPASDKPKMMENSTVNSALQTPLHTKINIKTMVMGAALTAVLASSGCATSSFPHPWHRQPQ